jgi:hypothetical protein
MEHFQPIMQHSTITEAPKLSQQPLHSSQHKVFQVLLSQYETLSPQKCPIRRFRWKFITKSLSKYNFHITYNLHPLYQLEPHAKHLQWPPQKEHGTATHAALQMSLIATVEFPSAANLNAPMYV